MTCFWSTETYFNTLHYVDYTLRLTNHHRYNKLYR